jgi:Recombinase
MEREHAETSLRRRGLEGALANKREAELRARALVSILRELMAAGIISRPALARELSRRGIPTAHGGKWHTNTVTRMLKRLGLLTSGKDGRINNGQVSKRAADARLESFGLTIRALQGKGFVLPTAIALELNERGIAAARGGKWNRRRVTRLLRRLQERLEP